MSETTSKTKSESKGQKFLKIVGRDAKSISTKQEKKAAKTLYETARDALSPWYDKGGVLSAGKVHKLASLEWLADEYSTFVTKVTEAQAAAKDDDWPLAARLYQQLKTDAEQLDAAKLVRASAQAQIGKITLAIGKLKPNAPEIPGLTKETTALEEELRRGDPPSAVLARAETLLLKVEGLGGVTGPVLSKIETERARYRAKLHELLNAEEARLGKLAFDRIPKDKVKFVEAEVRMALDDPALDLIQKLNASPNEAKLKDDTARSKDLLDRFTAAATAIKTLVGELEDSIKGETTPDFATKTAGRQASDTAKARDVVAEKAFLKDFAAVENALGTLADRGVSTTALATEIADDKKLILDTAAYGHGPMVIKSFLARIAAAEKTASTAVAGEAGTLTTQLAELRTKLSRASKASPDRTKPAFKALLTELSQLDVIVQTGNTGAFAAARQRMLVIQQAGVDAAAKIAEFNAKGDAIALVTKDKRVKTEFPSEVQDLLLGVQTLLGTLDLTVLGPAATAFAGLEREATALKAKTDALIAWRTQIKLRLAALDKDIKAYRKLVTDKVETTFIQNAAEVETAYTAVGVDRVATEAMLADAERVLAAVLPKLQAGGAQATKARTMLGLDKQAAAAKTADKETASEAITAKHEQLDLDLRAYVTLWKATEKKVSDEKGDKDELKELKELGAQARKKFKAGDDDGARQQLATIKGRLAKLNETPGGVTVERVKDLATVGTLWTNAMKEMQAGLDGVRIPAVASALKAGMDGDAIKTRIEAFSAKFEPFRAPLVRNVLILIDPDAALKARKTAREEALASIRSIRTLLDSPVTAKLINNPFNVPSPFTGFRRMLSNLEYNALRAVPPE